jgi:tRNA A37 threonylcarbamoyladenosine dehydratase
LTSSEGERRNGDGDIGHSGDDARMEHDVGSTDVERRFGGIKRLGGEQALERLSSACVCVVGIGGVGSWAAEALARTGVGHVLLIDLDHVAVSNVNRQIHATDATLGQSKVLAMRDRIAAFAPSCRVEVRDEFLDAENLTALLSVERAQKPAWPDVLLDCCDQSSAKIAMALFARQARMPFIMAGSAGGKWEAERLQCGDLSASTQDPMLSKIRQRLRREHGFERNPARRMKVACVWSDEPVKRSDLCDPAAGLNCAGYGSMVSTTASMGMIMAGWAVRTLLAPPKS